jgi:hypothetical protein
MTLIQPIPMRSNLSSLKPFRLAGSAVIVIMVVKAKPHQIVESVIIWITVQMRDLPLTHYVFVI